MKIINIALVHFILIGYVLISSVLLLFLPANDSVVLFTQINLFFTFFWILYAQIKLNGLLHLFTIFLGLFFIFLLSLPFFDLINFLDISKIYLFRPTRLSSSIFIEVYSYSCLFLIFIFAGVIFGYKDIRELNSKKEVTHNKLLFNAGITIFIIALPGLLTKYYLQLKVVLQKGYLAVYDGSLQQIDYPIICMGAGTLLLIGYCLFISSKPTKRQYLIFTSFFILTQIINVLKGQRSVLMFPLVFSVWFYFRFYVEEIPKLKILIFIAVVAIFSQSINYFRTKRLPVKVEQTFAEKYLIGFFESQGVSFFILPYMLHYKVENNRYPYLFAPLDFRSIGKPQNIDRLHKFNYLPDHLMYKMLPDSYNGGGGLGSSILAVFYDIKNIIAFPIIFVIGFLISKFDAYVRHSRYLLLSSYYLVYAITSSIRYEPLQLFYDLVILWVFFAILECLIFKANMNLRSKSELFQ